MLQLLQLGQNIKEINIRLQFHQYSQYSIPMKSSFKKIQKTNTNTQTCFFGHPQFDSIFANAITKGQLIAIEQDHPSTHYLALSRSFISHHYAEGLTSVVFDSNNRWKYLVSPPMKKQEKQSQTVTKSEIAWRYDGMKIEQVKLPVDERIQVMDLSKQIGQVSQKLLQFHSYPNKQPAEIYRAIEDALISAQIDQKDTTAKKLMLSSLPAFLFKNQGFSQFLKALKCLTRSTNTLTLMTVAPIIDERRRKLITKHVDYYLRLTGAPKGYKQFTGIMSIIKEGQVGSLRNQFSKCLIWGLKRQTRQIVIQTLYEQAFEGEEKATAQKDDF